MLRKKQSPSFNLLFFPLKDQYKVAIIEKFKNKTKKDKSKQSLLVSNLNFLTF